MTTRALALVFLGAVGALGCGDDDGRTPTADGGTERADSGEMPTDGQAAVDGGVDAWERYCTMVGPAREMECYPGDTFDVEECQTTGACLETLFIPGSLDDVATCLGELECNASDDHCAAPATSGRSFSAAAMAFIENCETRRTTCAEGTGFSDDYCFPGLSSDPTIARLEDCLLPSDCDAVRGCLIDVFTCSG